MTPFPHRGRTIAWVTGPMRRLGRRRNGARTGAGHVWSGRSRGGGLPDTGDLGELSAWGEAGHLHAAFTRAAARRHRAGVGWGLSAPHSGGGDVVGVRLAPT